MTLCSFSFCRLLKTSHIHRRTGTIRLGGAVPHCLIVEISYLLPQNVRKNMRLQSLKGIKLYVIETQFLEPHILYVGLLDLVTIEIHSKDLLQNNDFHITSSIFLLSSVLVFYFFLILFFNSIVYRFFIARIFGVLPEYFRDWGGCRPPPPAPPGSYAYAHIGFLFAEIRAKRSQGLVPMKQVI